MKKLLLAYAKKSVSVFLAVLMLMTCWVFIAPQKAEAATAYGMEGIGSAKQGTFTFYNKDGNTGEYMQLTYPKEIYMDKSESLEGLGYTISVKNVYGNATEYRTVLLSTTWGGDSKTENGALHDNNMLSAFPNYSYTSELKTENWTVNSKKNNSLVITGGTTSGTVKLSGTPSGTGSWTFDPKSSTDDIVYLNQKINCNNWPDHNNDGDNNKPHRWKNFSDNSKSSGDMIIYVVVYDKEPLNNAVSYANSIYNNNSSYTGLVVGGNWSEFNTARTSGNTTLTTRKVTQNDITTATNNINTKANALKFQASNADLLTIIAKANELKATSDYSIKYTKATRDALEAALTNATTNTTYDTAVPTYTVNISDSSTWTAGSKANTDQTNINALTKALTDAYNAMVIQKYKVTFNYYNGDEASAIEYDYGTTADKVTVPANTNLPYDATNHYTYSWPTVNTVTGSVTYKETQTISGTHNFNNKNYENDTQHTRYCSCGYEFTEAHTPNAGTSIKPTCTTAGYITYQCTTCGHVYTKQGVNKDASGNEVPAPAAHTWAANISNNVAEGKHGIKCEKCDAWKDLTDHNWTLADTDIIKSPTCKEAGEGLYRCSCGATKTDTIAIDPNAHHYLDAVEIGDGKHSAICEYCGDAITDDCTDADSNCECDVCGYDFPHDYQNLVVADNRVSAADCDSYAVYYKSCSVCGDVSEDTFEDVNGGYGAHSWDDTETFLKSEAKCEIDAVYYYECLECGESSENVDGATWTKTGSALEHNYTANADKSNIINNGDGTHKYTCQNGCGTSGGEVVCDLGETYTYDNTNHYRECPDCGYVETNAHTMTDWESDNKDGAVAGTQSRYCAVCDYEEKNQDCNYEKTVTPATCTTGTITSYVCSDCGHGYSENDGVVNEANHADYGTWTDESTAVASTCTVNGKDADKKCLGCNAVRETGAQRPLDYTNHGDNSTSVDGYIEATCTIEGHTGKVVCDGCGNTITEDTVVGIDENNHVNTTAHDGLAATCEKDGYTAYETCDACGDELGKTILTKSGHNYTGDPVVLQGDIHSYECVNGCGTIGVGTTKAETENCFGGTATCTALAECEVCGDTWGELAMHVFEGEYKQLEGKDEHYRQCLSCDAYGLGTTYTVGESEACSGGEADCLNKAVCDLCESEYGSALGHDYSADADRINNPEEGYHNYQCSRCDAYGIVEDGVQVDGGKIACYDAEPVRTAATCTEAAYYTHTCDTCGYVWVVTGTSEEDAALGHDYTEKIIDDAHKISDADCETAEVYWYDCSRCEKNAKDETDDKYTDLTFVNKAALGHKFDGEDKLLYKASDATCTAHETYYVYCSVCEKSSKGVEGKEATFTNYGTMLPHTYAEIVDTEDLSKNLKSEATCTEAAVYYKSCSVCGAQSTETFTYGEVKGHVFTEKIMDAAHRITTANCVTAATFWYDCANCTQNAGLLDQSEMTEEQIAALKYTDGDVAPNTHTSLKEIPFQAATCTVDGHSKYQYCEDCKAEIGKVTAGYEAKGHDFNGEINHIEDTDTHNFKCLNCDAYGIGKGVKEEGENKTVDCIFGDWTHVDDTLTHSQACECGNTKTGNCVDSDPTVVLPTCTADGYTAHECDVCGHEWTTDPTTKLDHDYPDEWTSNGDGTHSKVCANNCGKDLTEDCSGGTATCANKAVCEVCEEPYGETTDHLFITYVQSEEAKCGVNAKEKAKCEYCDATDEREIPGTALTHKMSAYTTDAEGGKKPTCKEEGIEVSTCEHGCGFTLTQAVPVDKNAHVWGEWEPIGGDCATGITEERVCSVCGNTENRLNTEVEHDYAEIAKVNATCLIDGYIEYRCTKCNFTYKFDNTVEGFYDEAAPELIAKGEHTWGDEVIETKAPTCAHEGRGYQICTVCNEKSGNVAIAKLGHGWEDNDGNENDYIYNAPVDATCDTDGHSGYYECLQCASGKTEPEQIFKATGHADNDGDGKCDGCKGEIYDDGDGTGSCGCICHKDNWFMQIIYKIVRFFWKLFKIGKSCDCGFVHY